MKKVVTVLVVIAVVMVVLLLLGPVYILSEGEQSVVTRFGAIIDAETDAGLKFKMPVIDTVLKYPKKILSWDGDAQRVPTSENQFIWIDTTARWRIVDSIKFYESVTTLEQGWSRLDDVIDSSVRTVIAANSLKEAVRNSNIINEIERDSTTLYEEISVGREVLSNEMFDTASRLTKQFGIELIDILIRQIRYSDDLTESVYNRMIKERRQIAETYRSEGEGKKATWLGKLDNDKRSILSAAYETSETLKGTADAEATKIYSEAYGNNAEFFEFWRSIESYKKVLPNFRKTLSTDMEYFKYLYNADGR